MKYAITGHTDGLGRAISTKVDHIGFSKSTGYDITNIEHRKNIIDQSINSDVFINNAYAEYAQTDLLYELYNEWKCLNKIIVNIGSNTTDGIKSYPHKYTAHKASLDKASEQLSNLKNNCRVILIKFGWIGTDRVIRDYQPTQYINTNDAAEMIINCVNISKKYNLTHFTCLPE
jgi:NAD(P)-dependent dehydrogenase (short-subunit alcohol dehydrogenase family)